MARIDCNHIRHAYGPNPKSDKDYALHEVHHTCERWRRLCAARAVRLRQDHAAQHHLGPGAPVARGRIAVRRQRRDATCRRRQRNIAQVFQFPVIYDTMTVYDNLAFPLRNRGVRRSPRSTAASSEIAGDDRAHRHGASARREGLTADQKQKISLGRGLVRHDVNAILFDEPLTVIDPHMKWVLRRSSSELHKRVRLHHGLCHPRPDRGADLRRQGRGHVRGPACCRSARPPSCSSGRRHTFVGYFIGSPGMNVLPCTRRRWRRGRQWGERARRDRRRACIGCSLPERARRSCSRAHRQAGARHPARATCACAGRPRRHHRRSAEPARGRDDRCRGGSRPAPRSSPATIAAHRIKIETRHGRRWLMTEGATRRVHLPPEHICLYENDQLIVPSSHGSPA